MPQRGFNIGDLLQVLSTGAGAAYETDIFNRQQKQQQGIRLYDILQEQEGQAYQRRRQTKSDRLSQRYFDLAEDRFSYQKEKDALPEEFESLDDILSASLVDAVTTGKMDIREAIALKNEMTKKPDRPTDFKPKFDARVEKMKGQMPFALDEGGEQIFETDQLGRTVGVREELPADSLQSILDRDIWPQAAQEGLDYDSLQNLFGIDPVTGAVDFDMPQQLKTAMRPEQGAGLQRQRAAAMNSLRQQDTAGEWDTLTPEEKEMLIEDEIRRMMR